MVQEVDITSSLCQAVLLSATHPLPVVLIVSVLELRHAPAMLELVIKSAHVPPGWIAMLELLVKSARIPPGWIALLELLVKSVRILPGWIVASDHYADDLHLKHTNSL